MINPRRAKLVYASILVIAILWNLAIVAAPWTWARGHTAISSFFYLMFSPLCHQRADRSFFLMGHHWAVCNRCAGIYLGALVGLLLFPVFTSALRQKDHGPLVLGLPRRWPLFLALGLVAIDVGLDWVGVRTNTSVSRFLTGGICGIVAPFYLLPSILEIFAGTTSSFSPSVLMRVRPLEKS